MRTFTEQLNALKHYQKNSNNPDTVKRLIDAAERIDDLEDKQVIKIKEMVSALYSKIHQSIRKAKQGSKPQVAPKSEIMTIASRIRKEKKVSWLDAKKEAAKVIVEKRDLEEKKAMREFNKQYRKQLASALKGSSNKESDAPESFLIHALKVSGEKIVSKTKDILRKQSEPC